MNVRQCLFVGSALTLFAAGLMPVACGGKVNVNQTVITANGGGGNGGGGGSGGEIGVRTEEEPHFFGCGPG